MPQKSFILLSLRIGMYLSIVNVIAWMKYLRILHKVYKKIINLQSSNLIGFPCIEVISARVKWSEVG